MTRGSLRPLPLLIYLLVLSACLAACGGGGSDETASPVQTGKVEGEVRASSGGAKGSPAGDAASGKGAKGGRDAKGRSRMPPVEREAEERAAYERKRYGSPSSRSAPFTQYSGEGQAKLHLAEFGDEAAPSVRREAGSAVAEYLRSSAEADWAKACSLLAGEVHAELARAGGCPASLPGILEADGGSTGQGRRVGVPGNVASLRIEAGGRAGEGAGFALFHGVDGKDYWIAVKRQGGRWRILTIAPQAFE